MDNQKAIEEICNSKISRLKELSKKGHGEKFLHHSTLSGYIGEYEGPTNDRLYKIAKEGLVPSKSLNKMLEGKSSDNKGQSSVSLLPDFQPVFAIDGDAKAIFIVDPDVLDKSRKMALKKQTRSFITGEYMNRLGLGMDLCEFFEVSTRIIQPRNILGVIIKDYEITDDIFRYQCATEDAKKEAISKFPPNFWFIKAFEDAPENSFPVFKCGTKYRKIDPTGRVDVIGQFIDLKNVLSNRVFPYDPNDCPPQSSFEEHALIQRKLTENGEDEYDFDLSEHHCIEEEKRNKLIKDANRIGKNLGFKIKEDYISEELVNDLNRFVAEGGYERLRKKGRERFTAFLSKVQNASNYHEAILKLHNISYQLDEDGQHRYFKLYCRSNSFNKSADYLNFMRSKLSREDFEEKHELKIPQKTLELKERYENKYMNK
jgi:hypothetical protein